MNNRRVSEEEAVAREAALEAAREELSQQQAKAVANVRRRSGAISLVSISSPPKRAEKSRTARLVAVIIRLLRLQSLYAF